MELSENYTVFDNGIAGGVSQVAASHGGGAAAAAGATPGRAHQPAVLPQQRPFRHPRHLFGYTPMRFGVVLGGIFFSFFRFPLISFHSVPCARDIVAHGI